MVPVIGRARAAGRSWLRVRLPQRPNGATGWMAADGTLPGVVHWRVVVDRSARRARILRDGHTVRLARVVVGSRSTPTPTGRFFVAERVRQPPAPQLGPWVLATSAYSDVLQEFAGGPGRSACTGAPGSPTRSGRRPPMAASASRIGVDHLARPARPAGTPVRVQR